MSAIETEAVADATFTETAMEIGRGGSQREVSLAWTLPADRFKEPYPAGFLPTSVTVGLCDIWTGEGKNDRPCVVRFSFCEGCAAVYLCPNLRAAAALVRELEPLMRTAGRSAVGDGLESHFGGMCDKDCKVCAIIRQLAR